MRALLVTVSLLAGCARPAPPPPNILLVTMDTVRADAMGAYGQPLPVSPTFDALAAEGARFTRAYTVTPLTIPAHSSIMTGAYPPRHGVRDNGDFFLGDETVTLAERLKAKGYATMASVGAEVTSHHWGFAQGFDAYFDQLQHDGDEKNRWRVERPGNQVVDDALGWLNERPKDAPWFAWIHMYDAHSPHEPPATAEERIPGRPYLAEVSFVDEQLGRLVEAVKARREWDRTWIVAVADHGEGMGDHGEAMHGVLLYDVTTRLPYVIRAPGAKAQVVGTPASLVDLAPTLLAAAGAEPLPGADGVDLGPVVRGVAGDATRSVYAESLYAWRHYGWAPQRALVTDEYKLLDSTTSELYDRKDTREHNDLSEKRPEVKAELTTALDAKYAAMAPSGAAQAAVLDPERIAQLEALGYMAGGASAEPVGDLPKGLPDPRTNLPLLKEVEAARQALQAGDADTARARLEAVLEKDPGLTESRMMLAQILLRAGNVEDGLAIAEALDAEKPSSTTKAFLGNVELARGRIDRAIVLFRTATELDPYVVTAWIGYLHALAAGGDPSLPSEAERAWKLLPDQPALAGMVGFARALSGRMDEARPLVTAAIEADPTQPFVHQALGLVAKAANDPNGAEAAFQEEVRLAPPAIPARRELVALYADQKRYEEQLAQLTVIRERTPPEPYTLHSEAQALFNLGRYNEAESVVTECRSLAPEYPGCAMLEANVLEKLGRHADAVKAYEAALALAGQKPKDGAGGAGGAAVAEKPSAP